MSSYGENISGIPVGDASWSSNRADGMDRTRPWQTRTMVHDLHITGFTIERQDMRLSIRHSLLLQHAKLNDGVLVERCDPIGCFPDRPFGVEHRIVEVVEALDR